MPTRADALAAEPYTLCLSAGFFGFFAHTGVLSELERRDLLPQRVVGISAGSLAGGLWGLGLSADRLSERLAVIEREEFWDPGLPLGGILRGRKFDGVLNELLTEAGASDLQRGKTPVTVLVWELRARRLRRLDRGPAAPAIRASCALPGLFRPVRVNGRLCWDGGIGDRSGTTALRAGERALYCNLPHNVPWPEFGSAAEALDAPEGRWCFEPSGLPRVHPFALDRGAQAMRLAQENFANWLDGAA